LGIFEKIPNPKNFNALRDDEEDYIELDLYFNCSEKHKKRCYTQNSVTPYVLNYDKILIEYDCLSIKQGNNDISRPQDLIEHGGKSIE
jgi:hypothetical protein